MIYVVRGKKIEYIYSILSSAGRLITGSGVGGGSLTRCARVLEAQKSASVRNQHELAGMQNVDAERVSEHTQTHVGSASRRGAHAQSNTRTVRGAFDARATSWRSK